MNRRARRPRALLLAVLALGVLAPEVATAAPEVVTVWHAYRGAEKQALETVAERFNQEHDGVQIELLAQPNDSYASKLTTAIPRDNGPDVFIFGHDRIGDWAETDLIAPVDPQSADLDRFLPEVLEPARYRGVLWGLPLAFKSTVLFYNRALVESPPRTTDQLIARGQELRERGLFGLAYLYDDFYYHAAWHFGMGADLWTDQGGLALASDESLSAMAFARRLYQAGLMPEEPTGALVAQLFNEGKAAMVINGPWFIGEIDEGVDFGVAPLPRISGTAGRARPFLTTEMAIVSTRSPRLKAARQVQAYLAGETSALVRATVGRQAVGHAGAWDDPRVSGDPLLQVFREQLPHTRPMGNQPRDRTVWEPTLLMLRKLFRRGASPAEAARAGLRRHAAITRPPPTGASPTLYLILLTILIVAALGYLLRSILRLRRIARDAADRGAAMRGWLWISPAITGTVVLLFIPFAVGLALSLFAHRQGDWTFVGLANFGDILGAGTFAPTEPLSFYFALVVTILWTVVNLVLHVGIGLFLAIILARPGLRLRPLYRVLLIIPWAVPNYITALIWKAMFNTQRGVINGIIEALGGDPVAWFSSFPTAFFANVCANAWLGFPFMMVVCLGALQAVPADLYEAADVDGASGWQKFRHITLPLLKPALVPAMLIGTVWTFNQFNIVYLVSGGEPDNATDILISEAYRWAFTRQEQYGYAAAYAALIFVILLGWSVFAARMGQRVEAAA